MRSASSGCGCLCLRLGAGQAPQPQQARWHIVEPRHAVAIDAQPDAFEARQLDLRGTAAPHHDDIGVQREDALEVKTLAVADALDRLGSRGLVGIIAGADHTIARAGRKQHRGRPGGQAHDALRGPREFEHMLIVILQPQRVRLGGRRGADRRQPRERAQQPRQMPPGPAQSKKVAAKMVPSTACALASGSSPGMHAL